MSQIKDRRYGRVEDELLGRLRKSRSLDWSTGTWTVRHGGDTLARI